jgi:hypothetical protein
MIQLQNTMHAFEECFYVWFRVKLLVKCKIMKL